MSKWENVDDLDEHSINYIQLFNGETNQMLIVSEANNSVEFIFLNVTPEYENNKLVYIEDAEDIIRLTFKDDELYKAYNKLIEYLL